MSIFSWLVFLFSILLLFIVFVILVGLQSSHSEHLCHLQQVRQLLLRDFDLAGVDETQEGSKGSQLHPWQHHYRPLALTLQEKVLDNTG